jgi:glycosyltransferase involved in cell wall biosynthesis
MRILHTVESYSPAIGGMQEVVKQLSERLVKLGHEVTVAAKKHPERKENIVNGVHIEEFEIEGNYVRGMTGEIEKYREFLLNSKFDIVTNFAAQQWATDLALPILDKIKGKKVNVPTGFSGLYFPEFKDYFEKMKTWMKSYDANVFLSNDYRDINFARANGITKNHIIPNGAAADEFLPESKMDIRKKLGIGPEEFVLLHVGSYTGLKGHMEALKIYVKSKIRDGVILFIGHNNESFNSSIKSSKKFKMWKLLNSGSNKRVIVKHDLTREETIAAYKCADLFLFPSNVECSPIVLFECMAAKTPFLTTDVGNAKEIIEWSSCGMLLPTNIDAAGYSHAEIEESTRLLDDIYDNYILREQMGKQGFKAWEENFTWEILSKKYEGLYMNLLNQPS